MLIVHHLNDSRSQKIVWLLEELGLPYDIVNHQRDPATLMGPPALKALHPIGKAPVLDDDGRLMIESGAITDYILSRYGRGRLMPDPTGPDWMRYLEWSHVAIAAGMSPIMIKVYARAFGLAGAPIDRAADAELDRMLRHIDTSLGAGPWLLGDLFTAADVQLSFVPELARSLGSIEQYRHMAAWLARCHERPGFRASILRGGRYGFAS